MGLASLIIEMFFDLVYTACSVCFWNDDCCLPTLHPTHKASSSKAKNSRNSGSKKAKIQDDLEIVEAVVTTILDAKKNESNSKVKDKNKKDETKKEGGGGSGGGNEEGNTGNKKRKKKSNKKRAAAKEQEQSTSDKALAQKKARSSKLEDDEEEATKDKQMQTHSWLYCRYVVDLV